MGMVSEDNKDTLFTVLVNTTHQQYFTSEWLRKYTFIGMHNG